MHTAFTLVALLLALGSTIPPLPARAAACPPAVFAEARTLHEEQGEVLAISVDVRAVAQIDGGDLLRQIRFIDADNATVEAPNRQLQTVPSTLQLAPGASSGSFIVRKQSRGAPFMVRYVATDSCGDIEKFVGVGGMGADGAATPGSSVPPAANPTPNAPTRPSFATEARVALSPAPPGGVAAIAASVTSATATTALVDVEVYDSAGRKVFQQFFENERFAAGQRKTYAVEWPVPATAQVGTYRAVVAAFGPGWQAIEPWDYWTARATHFSVASVPATATPPPPTATRIPPTATPAPPTSTSVPPTATRIPPTATPVSPTATPVPPTATPVPPTATLVTTPAPPAGPAGLVTRRGSELIADGQPFKFVGLNLFDAAGRPGGYHCAWWGALSDDELDATLGRMRAEAGVTVLRFWAFQSYTAGGTDWAGIDRVVRLAKRHGLRLMPVLENGPEHCSEGGVKWHNGGRWYADAYRRDYRYGYPLSLPNYIERVVARYRDEPAILAWTIMNEAETDNVAALYDFARETSALVKRVDPNHLVALGTQSSGQAGTRGADFVRVHGLSTIDLIDGHDYAYWGDDNNPLPGSPDGRTLPNPASCDNYRAIACSIAQAVLLLGKPFVMGEAGIQAGVSGAVSTGQRAALIDAKMLAAFDSGVAGYVPWQWNRIVDEGYDLLPNDPLMAVLKRYAGAS